MFVTIVTTLDLIRCVLVVKYHPTGPQEEADFGSLHQGFSVVVAGTEGRDTDGDVVYQAGPPLGFVDVPDVEKIGWYTRTRLPVDDADRQRVAFGIGGAVENDVVHSRKKDGKTIITGSFPFLFPNNF